MVAARNSATRPVQRPGRGKGNESGASVHKETDP